MREFVHCNFKHCRSGCFAGSAHVGSHAEVHLHHLFRGRVGLAVIKHAAGPCRALDELVHYRGVHDRVVLDADDPAAGIRADLDLVDGGGACSDRAKHLVAFENELYRLLHDLRCHRREHHMRPRCAFAAEAAAGVGALYAHVLQRKVEDAG